MLSWDIVSSSPPSADVEVDSERWEDRERVLLLAGPPAMTASETLMRSRPRWEPVELLREAEEAGKREWGFHSSPSTSAWSFKVGELLSGSTGEGSPLQVRVGEMPPEPVEGGVMVLPGWWRTWGLRMERGGGGTGWRRWRMGWEWWDMVEEEWKGGWTGWGGAS